MVARSAGLIGVAAAIGVAMAGGACGFTGMGTREDDTPETGAANADADASQAEEAEAPRFAHRRVVTIDGSMVAVALAKRQAVDDAHERATCDRLG